MRGASKQSARKACLLPRLAILFDRGGVEGRRLAADEVLVLGDERGF